MEVIFRDDDVFLNEPWFEDFLKIFLDNEIPITLAVVPSRITKKCYAIIKKYLDTGLIEVIQHNFSHMAYEPYSEFPNSRPKLAVRQDLELGKKKLEKIFKKHYTNILAPAWHQITKEHYENIKDLYDGITARPSPLNEGVKINFPVTYSVATTKEFRTAEQIISGFKEGLNIILMHHFYYERDLKQIKKLRKVVKYLKDNKIKVTKYNEKI